MQVSATDKRIVTLTMNPTVDIATGLPKLEPNRKLRCADPHLYPGGGGINVARMLHRLGQGVIAVYPYGGCTGARLRHMLKKEGVEQCPIVIRGENRESFIVSEQASQDVYRFIMPGPLLSSREQELCLSRLQKELEKAAFLVVSGSLPRGVDPVFYGRVSAIARKSRVTMLLDAPPAQIGEALEQGFHLLRLNQSEFEELTGGTRLKVSQIQHQAIKLLRHYPIEALIVTLSRGAFLFSGETIYGVTAPSVEKRNPSGAGDCFVAGYVSRWLRSRSFSDSLCFGVASAAAAMQTEGGELATPESIEQLVEQIDILRPVQVPELLPAL